MERNERSWVVTYDYPDVCTLYQEHYKTFEDAMRQIQIDWGFEWPMHERSVKLNGAIITIEYKTPGR